MCIFPNDGIYIKLEDNRDTIDQSIFYFNKISNISDLYGYKKMIITYKNDQGLEIDTDDEEYQTSRLHRPKSLNYWSSVIKEKSFTNGHFKESNEAPNDSYKFNLKGFDMIKAVADERAHLALTNKKELAICVA